MKRKTVNTLYRKKHKLIISFLFVACMFLQLTAFAESEQPVMEQSAVSDNNITVEETQPEQNIQPEETHGLSDDVLIVGEDESMREESVKHFYLDNGEMLAVMYSYPVHYQDDE